MDDCWRLIFQFAFLKFKDFKNIRLVNKQFLNLSKLLWFQDVDYLYAPSTFVFTALCSVCGKKANRNKSVPYGRYPRAIYIYCDDFKCTRTVIRNLVQDADEKQIDILVREAVTEEGLCPRTNGSSSPCLFSTGWMWKSKRVRCILGNQYKDVSLDDINAEFKLKYKILKL